MLFEPLPLRGLTLRNRTMLSPMCMYSAPRDSGLPTPWHDAHYAARAMGGFGLVITEATAVAPEGRISPHDLGLWSDGQVDAWRRMVDACHDGGAPVCVQLAHAGRKAGTHRGFPGEDSGAVSLDEGGWVPVGPSDEPFPGLNQPRSLTQAEIDGVVEQFAAAARRARDAGVDAMEIHSAHGYLLHQFLSPLSNHRSDEYGGSLANRCRLVLRVTAAVREAVGDEVPVLVRISGTDWVSGGWTIEDSVSLAPRLRDAGADLIDVSSGGNTPSAPPVPIVPGYQVELAARVRETGIPTGAVGLLTEAEQAERVLAAGDADAILIGRAALREPAWPLRAAHDLGVDAAELYPPQYARGRWR